MTIDTIYDFYSFIVKTLEDVYKRQIYEYEEGFVSLDSLLCGIQRL